MKDVTSGAVNARDTDGATKSATPATIVFRRRVRPGREAEYERWLATVQEASRGARGYVGVETIRPAEGAGIPEYVSVARFASHDDLRAWEESGVLKDRLAQLPADVVEGDAEVKQLDGLEFWFRAPGAQVVAPSRYKMVLVLIPLVVAIVSVLGPVVRRVLGDANPLLRLAITASLQVTLLTYVIMPRVTRWLAAWLFSSRSRSRVIHH
jgi:uncharacterized protein